MSLQIEVDLVFEFLDWCKFARKLWLSWRIWDPPFSKADYLLGRQGCTPFIGWRGWVSFGLAKMDLRLSFYLCQLSKLICW